jgi:hypothetical protein
LSVLARANPLPAIVMMSPGFPLAGRIASSEDAVRVRDRHDRWSFSQPDPCVHAEAIRPDAGGHEARERVAVLAREVEQREGARDLHAERLAFPGPAQDLDDEPVQFREPPDAPRVTIGFDPHSVGVEEIALEKPEVVARDDLCGRRKRLRDSHEAFRLQVGVEVLRGDRETKPKLRRGFRKGLRDVDLVRARRGLEDSFTDSPRPHRG